MSAARPAGRRRAAVRCAIYTRKSTDEGLDQTFNTLDAQREAGEAFINSQRHEGWIALPDMAGLATHKGNGARAAIDRLADLHDKVASLDGRLAQVRYELAELEGQQFDIADLDLALQRFDPVWEQVNSHEQERFVRTLVEQVRYDGKTGNVTVSFKSAGLKQLCGFAHAEDRKPC